MQANVYTQYGSLDVIKFQEAAQPTPKANQLLIQVHAAALNAAEIHLISGSPFFLRFMEGGLRQPAHPIPGADIAGRVVAVGAQCVASPKPGLSEAPKIVRRAHLQSIVATAIAGA